MRGYLDIVSVAARGSTGLYVRRGSSDRVELSLRGSGAQEIGCGTVMMSLMYPANLLGCAHHYPQRSTLLGIPSADNWLSLYHLVGVYHPASSFGCSSLSPL